MKIRIFLLFVLIVLFTGCLDARSDDKVGTITGQEEVIIDKPGEKTIKGLTFLTEIGPALEEAKINEKPVFVYLRSEYCGWCRKFEEETFTNRNVIEKLNNDYTLLTLDVIK